MDPHNKHDKKYARYPRAISVPETVANPGNCLRCGTCCLKGGPGLHREDRALIENGQIPSKYLYTIRKSERVYDNVKGCLVPADSDIIKIKGQGGSWTCIFFEAGKKGCSIYDDRPLECRRLKCWDTGELERIYDRNRLTRQDLISQVEGLWDLVQDHQVRCDYGKIIKLIDDLNGPDSDSARRQLAEIIQYDAEIRKLAVAKGGLDPAQLDFIFGRPLTETLPGYGIRIRQDGSKTIVTRQR